MTSSGLEPATFRLVALPLNQLRYRVPLARWVAPGNRLFPGLRGGWTDSSAMVGNLSNGRETFL
jgi:hypothetical protein